MRLELGTEPGLGNLVSGISGFSAYWVTGSGLDFVERSNKSVKALLLG
jgi:hypothetical protein